MSGDKLKAIDAQIARLQRERDELAADPARVQIRETYGELERVLDRLEELGENVITDEGQTITILGTRFYYAHGCDLRER